MIPKDKMDNNKIIAHLVSILNPTDDNVANNIYMRKNTKLLNNKLIEVKLIHDKIYENPKLISGYLNEEQVNNADNIAFFKLHFKPEFIPKVTAIFFR